MKVEYAKTIFVDENGEIISNEYDRTEYEIKKQWYEAKIKPGNKNAEPGKIYQRYVILQQKKNRQLKLEF